MDNDQEYLKSQYRLAAAAAIMQLIVGIMIAAINPYLGFIVGAVGVVPLINMGKLQNLMENKAKKF